MALNIVSTKRLAWQERKAETFTVSPLHAGSACLAYRRSKRYGKGITIGTAMAISGAAASPNMGYHSSPTMSFLLTIFNVRLGLWIRNPRHKRFRLGARGNASSPWFGLFYLLAELFGMVNDEAAFVYARACRSWYGSGRAA